ncbi:MAG: abortive infection family protein [Rhodobacteraceae bacterium]|nr:abortive infection family protein [Paracoccaceae bacterium]MYF46754.1 abortive infection family protein [Paracoccaceae bacterium]
MKLSSKSISALQEIINGDTGYTSYRSGPMLIKFFNEFGREDKYGEGFPVRENYTKECIRSYNGTNILKQIVESSVDPRDFIFPDNQFVPYEISLEKAVNYLNEFLVFDGYILKQEEGMLAYKVFQIDEQIVHCENLTRLSHAFINDQIRKSKEKLAKSDFDGAITNARSLVEAFQEEIIRKTGNEVPKYDGDLQKLYKVTKQTLNLDPSQKDLSDTLKQILTGLNSLVIGISGLSNIMADRHSRSYKPSHHHAKLSVNCAFIFCEFLLDSYEYQKNQRIDK